LQVKILVDKQLILLHLSYWLFILAAGHFQLSESQTPHSSAISVIHLHLGVNLQSFLKVSSSSIFPLMPLNLPGTSLPLRGLAGFLPAYQYRFKEKKRNQCVRFSTFMYDSAELVGGALVFA